MEPQPQPLVPDQAAITADLELMTRRWGELEIPCMLELRSFAEGTPPAWAQFTPSRLAEAVEWAVQQNADGRNIYVVRNPIALAFKGSATDAAIVAAFFCWADCDDTTAADNVRRFDGPKWNATVTTGKVPETRVHVYWELAEPARNLEAWRQMQVAIATHFRSDPVVVNPSRIMRVGGTVSYPPPHKQARGYAVEACKFNATYPAGDEREPVEFERLLRVFGAGPAEPKPADGIRIDTGDHHHKTSDEYADILRRARTDGEKHSGVRDLAASLAGQGVSRQMAEAIVRDACPVWDRNVEHLLDSAYQKFYRRTDDTPPDIDFDTPSETAFPTHALEWFDDVEPSLSDGYLVKGVLAAGAMSVVYGPSNSGKSFLALDVSFHIAIESPWQGHRVRQAAVLYLAAEGGRGIANRIVALKAETGCVDVPLALRRAGLDLLKSSADLRHVVDLVDEMRQRYPQLPIMIVIDTLSRVIAGGDENSPADMTAFIRNIDAIRAHTGAHIMIVHHSGKDAARGARGHSSLRAATDTEIEVANEDGARAALVTKQRDYEGGQTFAFGLKSISLGFDPDGDEVTSCVVEWGDAEEFKAARAAGKGLGGNQKIIAETFDQMLAEGLRRPNPGGVGMPDPGKYWCVDRTELRRLSMGKMVCADPRSGFNKAIAALIDDRGVFVSGENLIWRTDRRIRE